MKGLGLNTAPLCSVMDSSPSLLQRLLAQFSYSQKINAILSIVLIAIIAMTALFMYEQFSLLHKTESELLGMRYQAQLRNIIELLTKQRLLHMHDKNDSNENRHTLDYLQLQLSQAFHEFIALDDQIGEPLATRHDDLDLRESITLLPLSLYHQWQALSDSLPNLEAQSSDRFQQELLNRINRLILYIGDASQLSFDDGMETRYLLNVMLHQLPNAQMLIGQMLNVAERVTDEKALQDQLFAFATLLSDNTERAKVQLNKVFIQDRHIDHEEATQQALSGALNSYLSSIGAFLETTYLLIDSQEALSSFRLHGLQASHNNFTLWHSVDEEITRLLDERITHISLWSYMILAAIAAILLLTSFATIVVLKESNRFLTEVFDTVCRLSEGNLMVRASNIVYDSEFEKLRLFLNKLGDRIETVTNKLQASSVELTSSTTQIAAAAKHQEGSLFQQEATTKKIVITAEEISSTAKGVATTIGNANKAVQKSSTLATTGRQELQQVKASMSQMLSASSSIALQLGTLNEKADAMTSIISTITTVADRTNLLSLNATIEAEKIGPSGKSFGVIAREIHRLANQIANATLGHGEDDRRDDHLRIRRCHRGWPLQQRNQSRRAASNGDQRTLRQDHHPAPRADEQLRADQPRHTQPVNRSRTD